MSSDDFTMLDMINVLKWYELIPNKIKILEQHARTKIKFQGLLAIHEDSSELLIANLVEYTSSKFSLSSNIELKSSRSLLANRIIRTNQEIKVMHNLIGMIDNKLDKQKK